jgi:xylulokinase
MPLYLGFDCSTQSLSATVIEVSRRVRRVVVDRSLSFDEELPSYGTTNGVLQDPGDPAVVVSPPLMWAEALDRLMAGIAREKAIDISEIRAISGSAQQHGSVYFTAEAATALGTLDPRRPLVDQLRTCFSRPVAPVWMDTSTSAECAGIESAVGGPGALARLTGSRAFERFTGPQIRRFASSDEGGYARTDRVALVSSYMASLLAGCHAPTEPGDAAGMHLMDIATREWAPAAIAATAADLERRLPPIQDSWSTAGGLAPYWTRRYGFPAGARVVCWTGDNPSTLIGAGLVSEGRIGVSLGTSDTLFGPMRQPHVDPSGAAHVFGSPTGEFMSLICFRNGGLARERVRGMFDLTWEGVSDVLRTTAPGNAGAVMLPWFEPEITPAVREPGVRRYGFAPHDARASVRGVIEAQMLSLQRHSRWMNVRVGAIVAAGGASVNREILQILADVFDADACRLATANAACLGAALRAYHADARAAGAPIRWDEVVAGFADRDSERIRPVAGNVRAYRDVAPLHAACEAHALGAGADPAPLIEAYRAAQGLRG